MFWKISSKQNAGTIIRNFGSLVVFGSFAVGAYYLSNFITTYLLDTVRIGTFLFHRFIGMVLFIFFIMINVGNMVVSYSTLYRSPEVNFLLTSPISYLNIFIIKFLDNFFYSSGTLFMIGIAVLLGYGSYFHLPWHFYVLMMFGVLVPFMFLAACLAVIALLIVMKLASTINFRIIVSSIVVLYACQIYFYFKVTSPVHLVQEVMRYYPYVDLYFGSLDPSIVKLLPNFWVSEILYFYTDGNFTAAGGYVFLLIMITCGTFIFVLVSGNALFYRSWLTSLSLKNVKLKKRSTRVPFFDFTRRSALPSQIEVLLKKEYWQFVREPGQWIHFIILMGLLIVFLSSVSSLNIKLEAPELKSVVYIVVFIFNIFLINSIALRFGFPLVSLEGKAYWSLRSSPISTIKMYLVKFSIVIIFLLILSVVIAWLSNIPYLYTREVFDQQTRTHVIMVPHYAIKQLAYFSIVTTPIVTLTLASLNVGLGSVYADFIEKNPIRIASSQGATMTFLLSIVYLVIILAFYYFPTLMLFNTEFTDGQINWRTLEVVFIGITVLSFGIIGISHLLGIRSLKRDI